MTTTQTISMIVLLCVGFIIVYLTFRRKKFHVFNYTDGIYATMEPMTRKECEKFIVNKRKMFREVQGFYSNHRMERMDPDDVAYEIIPEDANPFER